MCSVDQIRTSPKGKMEETEKDKQKKNDSTPLYNGSLTLSRLVQLSRGFTLRWIAPWWQNRDIVRWRISQNTLSSIASSIDFSSVRINDVQHSDYPDESPCLSSKIWRVSIICSICIAHRCKTWLSYLWCYLLIYRCSNSIDLRDKNVGGRHAQKWKSLPRDANIFFLAKSTRVKCTLKCEVLWTRWNFSLTSCRYFQIIIF